MGSGSVIAVVGPLWCQCWLLDLCLSGDSNQRPPGRKHISVQSRTCGAGSSRVTRRPGSKLWGLRALVRGPLWCQCLPVWGLEPATPRSQAHLCNRSATTSVKAKGPSDSRSLSPLLCIWPLRWQVMAGGIQAKTTPVKSHGLGLGDCRVVGGKLWGYVFQKTGFLKSCERCTEKPGYTGAHGRR